MGTTVEQRITFSFAVSEYIGALKELCEKAYGTALGIYSTGGSWVTGANVTSTAAAARRQTAVTFTATVPHTHAAAASNLSNALNATAMADHVAAVKAAESSSYGNISNFTVSAVAQPTISAPGAATPAAAPTAGTSTSDVSRSTSATLLLTALLGLVAAVAQQQR